MKCGNLGDKGLGISWELDLIKWNEFFIPATKKPTKTAKHGASWQILCI